MSRYVLGCDPGLQGAFALLARDSYKLVGIRDMPVTDNQVDPAKVAAIVREAIFLTDGDLTAAIENVNARPRQAGVWSFAVGVGIVHGVLGALGVERVLVSPAAWKSATGLRRALNESQAENKTKARMLAMKLWPEHADDFCLVKWDGRAESALIARYAATRGV